MRRSTTFLTTSVVAGLLLVGASPVPAAASNHSGAVDLTFPVDGPTSYIDDYDQPRGDGSRRHKATDLMTAYGQPVHAAVGGTITWITGLDDRPPSYGYMISIRGDDGRTYEYIHLGRQDRPASEAYAPGLRRDSRVERGQHLGYAGCSGNASCSAPHLHFAIDDPTVKDPYGTNYRNPYASLRDAQRRGDLPRVRRGWTPIVGDWNGDGATTPGWFKGGVFRLCVTVADGTCRTTARFSYGRAGDVPVAGDFNGDGTDTIGVRRRRIWHLRHGSGGGPADVSLSYGRPDDEPVVGDFTGDGTDTLGVRRGRAWYLRFSPGEGAADAAFGYGWADDLAVIGDWDGNGRDTVGVVRDGTWHLRDRLARGGADRSLRYGAASGDVPVTGDWTAAGRSGIGVVRDGSWHLKDAPAAGRADRTVRWR